MNIIVSEKKMRNSGLELLRIFSILLIIAHHYSVHGEWNPIHYTDITKNVFFVQCLAMGGKVACNAFVLITGYFMAKSNMKMRKIMLMIAQMFLYSYVILAIFYGFKIVPFELVTFQQELLPVVWADWFVVGYIILMFLTPAINVMIQNLSQKMFARLILVLVVVWSVIPTFTYLTASELGSFSSVDFFLVMYLIGAYFRLYPPRWAARKWTMLLASLGCFAALYGSVFMFNQLAKYYRDDFWLNIATSWKDAWNIFALGAAVFAFVAFKNMKFQSKMINWMAASCLGIYLIHDNVIVRHYIWAVFYPNADYLKSPQLVLHAGAKILFVFATCLVIDKIRRYVLEVPLERFLEWRKERKVNS